MAYDNDVELTTKELVESRNIAELIDEDTLKDMGRTVIELFEQDKESRSDWEVRTEESLKLALQVVEEKTFPWPDASNIKFPLLTIAALQFHARAYPALVPSHEVVKCRVIGADPNGLKGARAKRISQHMSYQILEEDENWEDQMDRVLITMPIVGCAFKKTYFDPIKECNISENILAKDLVVPYFTKSLETASRISHILYLTKNDIYERVTRGIYYEFETDALPSTTNTDILQVAQDEAQGITKMSTTSNDPYEVIEQHCLWDLDGDGYEEPYIVTVRRDTKQVLRIVARYFEKSIVRSNDKKILSIKAEHYFTKYPFVPSPDGGFYDLGFGVLLGPLNASINTLINQLVDAGTMANTAGGFLGRGVKIRGGDYSFKPLEWKKVDSTGDDLRKNIIPLPVREPSQVLFTLLSLLIGYGERIAGATDVMTGETPGQNTPAETTRNAVNQGMKIFSGIYKRTYRALKEEFRKLYRLNQLYMIDTDFQTTDGNVFILKDDYIEPTSDIRPNADPNVAGEEQRLQQAQALMQIASSGGGFNRYEVTKRFLEAINIADIEKIYPDPAGPNAIPPGVDPKMEIAKMDAQVKQMDGQIKLRLGTMKLMAEADVNRAKIQKLEAEAIRALAQAQGVDTGQQIALLQTQIGAAKAKQDGILKAVQLLKDIMSDTGEGNAKAGISRMAATTGNGELQTPPEEEAVGNIPVVGE